MDVTFLVTADTHFGWSEKIATPDHPEGVGVGKVNEIAVDTMNGIAGIMNLEDDNAALSEANTGLRSSNRSLRDAAKAERPKKAKNPNAT